MAVRGAHAHHPRLGRPEDGTQTLTDHDVLASVGSTRDAYGNSLAESFVDSFKTELINDRVWASRSQLELPIRRTRPGSELEIGDSVAAADSVRQHEASGLVHRCGEFAWATRAAMRAQQVSS